MMKYILFIAALLAVFQQLNAQRAGGYGGKGGYGNKGSNYYGGGRYPMNGVGGYYSNTEKESEDITSPAPSKRSGISAWGIVAIILCLIGVGAGVHYFLFCYPVLCKKQRKYDTIELTTV